jgi:hypothetical protein
VPPDIHNPLVAVDTHNLLVVVDIHNLLEADTHSLVEQVDIRVEQVDNHQIEQVGSHRNQLLLVEVDIHNQPQLAVVEDMQYHMAPN